MKRHLKIFRTAIAALLLSATWSVSAEAANTTFVVVRHAEKATGENPGLTPAGVARAKELARLSVDLGIEAVYATPYERTRQTAAPSAGEAGVEVRTDAIETGDLKGYYSKFVEELKQRHAGKRVLLVGHSNTVPVIVEALGATGAPRLGEYDYDDLFVVIVPSSGSAELLHLHYGAETP